MNRSPFRYSNTALEIIQLAVMPHARFALSLRNVRVSAYPIVLP